MNLKKGLLALTVCGLALALPSTYYATQADARTYGVDLAYGRRVVSSDALDGNLNVYAVDANASSRYAAVGDDNAYFYVNLGSIEKVGKVIFDWESAYASEYKLQMSLDAITWTTVANVTKDNSQKDEIVFPAWLETQFVKFQGVSRATQYGYSFFSLEVYGPESLTLNTAVVSVSSSEAPTVHRPEYMVDNLASTRWASASSDFQNAIFDLGTTKSFDLVKIRWEVSFARIFNVYGHPSSESAAPLASDLGWFKIIGSEVGLGEVDFLSLGENESTRYVKLELIQRETSENTKKTGRYPWLSTFSIYSFELFDWSSIFAAKLGNVMEYSKNSPAWAAMSNITLNPEGLLLAPQGYPTLADGKVTDMTSINRGRIPGFESYATYNPAVIYDNEREIFHMIYRTELPDNFATYYGTKYPLGHMSTLSYAWSTDGKHFTRGTNNPIAWPTSQYEAGGGLEDPRMFKIENDPIWAGKTTYYITYTMYDNNLTREGILYTHDFVTFTKSSRLSPLYDGAIKSGTFVTDPEGNAVKINDPRPDHYGKVYMIYMKDGAYTKVGFTDHVLRVESQDIVDLSVIGLGGNDIEDFTNGNESCMALTNIYGPDDEDIYLMYGGGRLSNGDLQNQQPNVHGWFYALGVLKTTKSNPFELTNLTLDLDEPTMYPTDTNKIDYGLFNKCMFADSMIRYNNEWLLYYGAGDMYVGLATARADLSAAATSYTLSDSTLTASTQALNRRYGTDQSDYDVTLVSEIYDLSGAKISETSAPYSIPHFTHDALGKYSRGTPISVSTDLSTVSGLPSNYYVVSYVKDGDGNALNNPSTYLVVTPSVTHVSR